MNKPSYKYTPVIAESHTPPYKIHKYFARRPHNVFNQLIREFSLEKETVLDPFCGGGVTIYEGVTQHRRMIGCDLNPLSIFIVRNMIKKLPNTQDIESCFENLRKYIMYLTNDYMYFEIDDQVYSTSWSEMALTVRCPSCGQSSLLLNELKIKNGKYHCSNKHCKLHSEGEIDVASCERTAPEYLYLVNSEKRKKTIKPYEKEDIQRVKSHLLFLNSEIIKNEMIIPQDLIPMDWDRQFEDGLAKKGINCFQDLFTKRNLLILLLIKHKILLYKDKLGQEQYELVRITFSNVLKDCNIMSFTNAGWQGGSPTTWSKHAYWIPTQFCEVSIPKAFEKSIVRIISSLKFNAEKDYCPDSTCSYNDFIHKKAETLLYNCTIGYAKLPDNSIDAIITDPPYGSNVQYLELSHFWYPWNKDLYKRYPIFELEAVANRKKGFDGAKDQYDYENNLFEVFRECFRVLKPSKYMCLTFNNKDICSWLALLFSILKSGFVFDNMYFQDGVKNYRQTAHTKAKGSPYGDFIYVFTKAENAIVKNYKSEDEFIQDIDKIFLREIICSSEDRNEIIVQMFKEAIPLIDAFAKSYLNNNSNHQLYKHFNKKYLTKLYIEQDENK